MGSRAGQQPWRPGPCRPRGVGFQVAGWLERLHQRPAVLRVFGGGTRSPAWTQLLADTTGVPLETLANPEAAAAGAAILAGAPGQSAISGRFEPDPVNVERYAHRRASWSRLRAEIYP
nr:FGGY-family carbohydrate kinase [Tessaracoccus coleopterorum]